MKNERNEKVEKVTNALEQGIQELFESEHYKKYLKVMSKLHNYSFNNSLLIAMQRPNATMVAGYTSWKKNFHRNVKKGEKGIRILAPAPYRIKKEVEKIDPVTQKPVIGANGESIKEHVQITIPAYKVTTVFDVDQTEGEELPEIAKPLQDKVKDFQKVFDIVKKISPVPIQLKEMHDGVNGYYDLNNKNIVIKKCMSDAQTLKTAIHEIGHAKLHDKDSGIEVNADQRTKEVEAESISYVVCNHLGVDTSEYSFGYIAGWSSGKKLEELKKSMNQIQHTASEIITDIDKERIRLEDSVKVKEENNDIDEEKKSKKITVHEEERKSKHRSH